MSVDASDSSTYFGELIRVLVEKWPGTDGKMTLSLHFLDLERDEVFIRAMPPDASLSSTAVVYDISGDIWEPLLPRPEGISLCDPVLDSFRSRILVHCNANDTLYAYYYDRKSWVCLGQKFCYWSESATIVDDVLYTVIYNYSGKFRSLEAYNLLDKKHLPVKWSSEFSVDPTMKGILYRLGNGKCILGWVNHKHMSFEYLRLTIWCNEQ
ncbi:hypothetical protein GOBAR_AA06616 [Gossypium barbadense]|uniref:F-box associated domain-containing protein n=1 Tax=Gossypium barbadense TaxID=3634 RepID=A0A2P5YEI6_GOSBA|nr:hypothetical protein GOBAR_AA06616 [Gossypium barbadense]